MIDAIGSEIPLQYLDEMKGGDKIADQVSALALKILPVINMHDVARIFKALSYLATKIEDVQYVEKFMLAYKHKNIEDIQALSEEIKQRPESVVLTEALNALFSTALEDNEDEIVDIMWNAFGHFLEMSDASDALESAINNGNVSRAQWLYSGLKCQDQKPQNLNL